MIWGSLSEYAADLVVDDLRTHLGYVALSTGNPLAGGSIGELSGDGYARQAVTFAPSSGGASVNSSLVQWVANGGDWSSPGQGWYLSVWDSPTGGNLIAVIVGSTGWPVTTMDPEVVAGGLDTIVDGATLRISPGVLRVAVPDALDPVAEILDLNPVVFWLWDRISYKGTDLLFADAACTTPITSNGDVIMGAKDLITGLVLSCSDAGRGPKYVAGYGYDMESSGNRYLDGDWTGKTSGNRDTSAIAAIWRVEAADKRFMGGATTSFSIGTSAVGDLYFFSTDTSPGNVSTLGGRKMTTFHNNRGAVFYPEMQGAIYVGTFAPGEFSLGRTGPSSDSRYNDTSGTMLALWDRQLGFDEMATLKQAMDKLGNDNYPYA